MITLHPHERAALERGSVLLLRPVEPQPPANIAIILPPPSRRVLDYWRETHDGQELPADWRMDAAFVVGDPLATDAGPVLVRAVRVVRCVEVMPQDVAPTGIVQFTGTRWPLFTLKHWWATLYPAHPWDAAWAWAVEVRRG